MTIRLLPYKIFLLSCVVFFVCIGMYVKDTMNSDEQPQLMNGERYIVVVIPSYNNSKWYKRNVESLFKQHYHNYRVIYIDDCSTDNTYALVKDMVFNNGQAHRFVLKKNSERHGALYNLYHAIHTCPDDAIIVTLDGDDWLKGPYVLKTINDAYADPHVWLTYGQYEEFPRGTLGICRPLAASVIAEKKYRLSAWCTSHLRTFYAGLFKKIKKEDLLYKGDFFQVTWDQAFMFPLLEMANGRIKYIDSILYVYNQVNPLNDFKINLREQLVCEKVIRQRKPYKPLDPSLLFQR